LDRLTPNEKPVPSFPLAQMGSYMSDEKHRNRSTNGTANQIRVTVRGLWKVFSPEEGPDLPVKFAGLSKAEAQANYGSVIALQDVSFDVYEGETFVVMGLSGSGKSTLVRCLNRLIEPTSGSVFFDGQDVLAYSEEELIDFRRAKTSMVFQQFGLLPHRTVLENAAWGLEVQDIPTAEREAQAQEILELVGLSGWEHYRPNALSGGMQQRVGLARALVSNPEILLMDEPFSALDPLIRRDMQNELVRIQGQLQKTTIFITHDLSEAVKLGSRIAIMRDGAIIQLGTPEEIVGHPIDEYVADFTRDVRPSTVLTVGYLMNQQGSHKLDPSSDRPTSQVDVGFTVDQAISESLKTAGDLSVLDESGQFVGVMEREKLLQAAFEHTTTSNGNHTATQIDSPFSESDSKAPSIIDSDPQNKLLGPIIDYFTQSNSLMKLALASVGLIALTVIVTLIWGMQVGFPFDFGKGISEWVNDSIRTLTRVGAPVFDAIADGVLRFLIVLENFFLWLPWATVVLAAGLLAWFTVSWKLALFSAVSLIAVGLVGLWDSAMETVALIVVAVIFSIAIAIPLGILAARNNLIDAIIRPILDGMQTMPAFVYLVPGIMLFGIGNVPAIFATVIYAVPPAIRLTNLGIRQVTPQIVEAAQAFGTTRWQLLFKVQLPMAIPTIMAGVNQTIMMALAMVVVASLVGAGGLGEDVLRALSRFKPGEALLGGLSIVALAIIVDRITQAWARDRQDALSVDTK
jgi:glycine betaine/proline transport system ATP-binding protein